MDRGVVIHKLVYKKSIRILYAVYGCYTICGNRVRYYKRLEDLMSKVDVNIIENQYSDSYYGSLKATNGREYGYIDNNVLYFVDRYGCLTGESWSCTDVNLYMDLRQFGKEIQSGKLINMNLNLENKLPDEKWKIDRLYRMFNTLNNWLSVSEAGKHYKLRADIRTKGEFEEKGIFTEQESGQFTPVIRFWATTGKKTGLFKYKFFIDGMQVFLYRKMRKLGFIDELMEQRNVTMMDEEKTYAYLERVLKREGVIDKRSRIRVEDGIVCAYIVEQYFPICKQQMLNFFAEKKMTELIEQLNNKNSNFVKPKRQLKVRSYNVLDTADYGMAATAKVVDSYVCREANIRFVVQDTDNPLDDYANLKQDFDNKDIEIYLAHYTDLVQRDMGFRQHIDTVYDAYGRSIKGGMKAKAQVMDAEGKFNKFSVGIPGFVEATRNMNPKVYTLAETFENWNYLNDNVFTVRDVCVEYKDFTAISDSVGERPCIRVGINIDEHSVSFGEVLEIYYVNKRTGKIRAFVIFSPRYKRKTDKTAKKPYTITKKQKLVRDVVA